MQNTLTVLSDSTSHLADKTEHMNTIMNEEIPYFRCSDMDIVKIYYFLWSIDLMYYVHVGKGYVT